LVGRKEGVESLEIQVRTAVSRKEGLIGSICEGVVWVQGARKQGGWVVWGHESEGPRRVGRVESG
jgi:hypothetical protein